MKDKHIVRAVGITNKSGTVAVCQYSDGSITVKYFPRKK